MIMPLELSTVPSDVWRDKFAEIFGLSPDPHVIIGRVYVAASGDANIEAEPPRLDCKHYFELSSALAQRMGKRVRITIETLQD